jgi:hypothetical protein
VHGRTATCGRGARTVCIIACRGSSITGRFCSPASGCHAEPEQAPRGRACMQTCDWDIIVFFYYMPFLPRGNLHLEGVSESADKLHAKAARFYSLLDSSDTSKS